MKDFAEGPWGDYWQIIRKIKIDKDNIIKIPGLPWKFSRTKCEPQNHLASRGMDNEKILFDLGYTKKDIKKLYLKIYYQRVIFNKKIKVTNSQKKKKITLCQYYISLLHVTLLLHTRNIQNYMIDLLTFSNAHYHL